MQMKKTTVKLMAREEYFINNGALLLEKQISSYRGRGKGPEQQLTIFSVQDIQRAVKNSDGPLFRSTGGRSSDVYKGTLDGRTVAVKIFPTSSMLKPISVLHEVAFKLLIDHRNVVKVYGCCLETKIPALVTEFCSNRNLDYYLHGTSHAGSHWISWPDRVRIAYEISHVLCYMHLAMTTPIVHRDVKSTSIFLDELYTAKLSNFQLSVSLPPKETYISEPIMGTFGYLDPEYVMTGRVTEKCDVYSFGVVLVELLTGMRSREFYLIYNFTSCPENESSPIIHPSLSEEGSSKKIEALGELPLECDRSSTSSRDSFSISKFLLRLLENDSSSIVHPRVLEEGDNEEIQAFRELALKCVRTKGDERPTMKEVSLELRRILHLARDLNKLSY